jgi:hypothetical protein
LFSGTRGSARTAEAGSSAGTGGTSTRPAPSLPRDSRLLPARELRLPGRLPVPTEPEYEADDSADDAAEPADAAGEAEKGDAPSPEPDDGPDAGPDTEPDDKGGPEAADAGASPQTVQ